MNVKERPEVELIQRAHAPTAPTGHSIHLLAWWIGQLEEQIVWYEKRCKWLRDELERERGLRTRGPGG